MLCVGTQHALLVKKALPSKLKNQAINALKALLKKLKRCIATPT
jgi:hypothetical protein